MSNNQDLLLKVLTKQRHVGLSRRGSVTSGGLVTDKWYFVQKVITESVKKKEGNSFRLPFLGRGTELHFPVLKCTCQNLNLDLHKEKSGTLLPLLVLSNLTCTKFVRASFSSRTECFSKDPVGVEKKVDLVRKDWSRSNFQPVLLGNDTPTEHETFYELSSGPQLCGLRSSWWEVTTVYFTEVCNGFQG